MQQQTFHWHILGAGSLGLLFAYHLAKAGHQVSLIGREKIQQPVNVTAIIKGQEKQQQVMLTHSKNCINIPLLLVTVKAYATANALASVQHALGSGSTVFMLQNGLGQLDGIELTQGIKILPAITQAGAEKTGPLTVIEHAKGQTFLPELAKNICQQAPWQCELPIKILGNFAQTQWQKLAINALINPLTAIHNCRNGDILQLPNFQTTATEVIDEIVMVAKHQHALLNNFSLMQAVIDVAKQTAGNSSSMREDIRHKKPTEIEFINGYIVNQGSKLGINTPANLSLLKQVQQLQRPLC